MHSSSPSYHQDHNSTNTSIDNIVNNMWTTMAQKWIKSSHIKVSEKYVRYGYENRFLWNLPMIVSSVLINLKLERSSHFSPMEYVGIEQHENLPERRAVTIFTLTRGVINNFLTFVMGQTSNTICCSWLQAQVSSKCLVWLLPTSISTKWLYLQTDINKICLFSKQLFCQLMIVFNNGSPLIRQNTPFDMY